jgi:two-component system sensor histidine kinase/response regulator
MRLEKYFLAFIAGCAVFRASFESTFFLLIDVAIGGASMFLFFSLKHLYRENHQEIESSAADVNQPPIVPPTLQGNEISFLSSMSHELRTPLNGILASAKLMQCTDTEGNNAESLDIIVRCGKQLDARISDLLDYAALDAVTLIARRSVIPIRELISGVSRVVASDAFDTQLGFSLDVDSNVPETIAVDPDRLYQVLDHMLNTALKGARRGSIVFSVSADVANSKNAKLLFQVNNIVHTPEDASSQLDIGVATNPSKATTFEAELDVSSRLTKKLVTLLEGELSIAPHPALGSTLTLPLAAKEAVAPPPMPALPSDVHITVFSDDRSMCALISRMADTIGRCAVATRPLSSFVQELSTIPSSHIVFIDCPATAPSVIIELVKISTPGTVRAIPIVPCNNLGALQKLHASGFSSCLVKPFLLSEFNRLIALPENIHQPQNRAQHSLRILVVDDVRINQLVLTKHLELAGHSVATASNGEEAINLLEQSEYFSPSVVRSSTGFDAIIMDINMPILSGLEATKIIREKEKNLGEKGVTSHIPIVGITADVVALDQEVFLLAGMEWCLTKPIDPRRLLQLIEHFGQLSLGNLAGENNPVEAIDLSWLRTQFENDEDVVSEILGAFLDEIDSLWLTLFRKVLTKESDGIRMSAHAIKGSLQSVGARAAAESARLIEYAAKAGTLEELDSLAGDLAQQVKSAKECAQSLALSRVGKVESDSGHSNLTATIETKG